MIIRSKFFWKRICCLGFFALAKLANAQPLEKNTAETSVERKFDTIREFQSYDPATYNWSKIEEFRDVNILENRKEARESLYIYRSFWAYDAIKKRWRKVDIQDHGYKKHKKKAREEKNTKKPQQSSSSFLRHWALGATIGGGYCVEQALWQGLQASISGDRILFHSNSNSHKPSYQLFFPSQRVERYSAASGNTALKNAIETHTASIPITLFTHYTFFNRVRLGVGSKIELRRFFIESMSSKLPVSNPAATLKQWMNHPAWHGTLGFNLVQTIDYNIALEFRAGSGYVLDALEKTFKNKATGKHVKDIQELWSLGYQNIQPEYIEKGRLLGVGLSYEQRLASSWKLLGKMGGNWVAKEKLYDSVPITSNENIQANEVLIYIDLGLQFNLGKDNAKKHVKLRKSRGKRLRRK